MPLLVVSAYGVSPGYISGSLPSKGENPPYIHDFGSILGFIEYVFGMNAQNPFGIAGTQSFPYADYLAPDGPNNPKCLPQSKCPYPLSDFFSFGDPSTFVPTTGAKYPSSCFHSPASPGCFGTSFQPADPDDDGID